MAQKHYGRFTKGDDETVAHSQAAAVRLRFEGWAEKTPPTKAARKELEEAVAPPADDPVLPEDAPPLGGKGSGADDWRKYATSKFDLEVEDDADRDDIVSAVADAHAAEVSGSGK